jgi:Ala-tRNA(Pro) deacylase
MATVAIMAIASQVGMTRTVSQVFQKILSLLHENDVRYQALEHEAVYTSEEAARVRGTSLDQAAKALVFRADGAPMLLVIPGDRRVDTKGFKKRFKIKDMRMASREDVEELTGLTPGAVPPFGNILGIPIYMDEMLLEKAETVFNAGSHTRSIKMSPQDLVALTQPVMGSYSR